MAFLGILMHLLETNISPACQHAVLDVCAKSVPVRGKTGEMRAITGSKLILTCPLMGQLTDIIALTNCNFVLIAKFHIS